MQTNLQIPSEIGLLTNLTWLGLGANQLTSVSTEIQLLVSLTVHGLYDNRLDTFPASLLRLTFLKGLGISSNRIQSTLPTKIWSAYKVVGLRPYNNSFSGNMPSGLSALSNCIRIDWRNTAGNFSAFKTTRINGLCWAARHLKPVWPCRIWHKIAPRVCPKKLSAVSALMVAPSWHHWLKAVNWKLL